MADVSFQAAEVKPMSRITQVMAEQIFGQGLGDPVKNDFGARSTIHQHWFDPAQVEGSALARLKAAGMSFMQANPVDGTSGDDRLVRDDLGFNQEMVAGPVADDLAPEQSPLTPFELAYLLDDCGRDQVVFQDSLELMAGEDGWKIEELLIRKPVPFAVGHNLQAHPFAEEDHDLLVVQMGKEQRKSGFYFLDDFGCGKGVPAGERQNDGLHG